MNMKETQFKNLHQVEAKIYNPYEKKLDSRITSGYFIGYPKKYKGYIFYCPNYSTRIVESGNTRFIENGKISEGMKPRKLEIQEIRVQIPLPITSFKVVVHAVVEHTNDF